MKLKQQFLLLMGLSSVAGVHAAQLSAEQMTNGQFVYCIAGEDCPERTAKQIVEVIAVISTPKVSKQTLEPILIFFDLGSAKAKKSELQKLDGLFGQNVTRMEVVGHTDQLGGKKINETLARQRANVIAAYLRKNQNRAEIVVRSSCCIESPPVNNKAARRASVAAEVVVNE